MKKTFFYALAAFAALTAGCSKDAGIDGAGAVGGGKYTLPAVSATLEESGTATKTGLGTNQVVNWSAKDRIAIINTESNTIYQYELVSGQGTSVGKFEPVGTVAAYDDINNLKAVYPAVAASVENGAISFTINNDWEETHRTNYNIISWTKDTPYAFTHNDIKVSYNTLEVPSNDQTPVNFKFRQLGTWCAFTFDFTGSDYTRETMESIEITTTSGMKKIGGKAEVDFTDPAAPVLKEGIEATVSWTFNTAASLAAPVSKSLMLFPGVDGDQLKITVKTALHTFTFYATPTQALTAGTVLRFPIEVDKNFSKSDQIADFAYLVEDAGSVVPFYYYGTSNCYLLASDATSVTVDATPYTANAYYEQTGTKATSAPAATKAELLWYEGFTTAPTVGSLSGNTFTVNVQSGECGNAVVAITDAFDNILWSYHIWKPELAIADNLLTYSVTNSGSYSVMPIALGAMNKATVATTGTAATNDTNSKSFGLYYQWGRKDPLGRPGTITASGTSGYVSTTFSDANITGWADATNNMVNLNTVITAETENVDRPMIDYTIKNPTKFIIVSDGEFNNNWAGKTNDNLWGNALGYNYPRASQLPEKSVFDPCPEGYRVAPKDLWLNFTKTKANTSASTEETKQEGFNAVNYNTMATQRGYFFCYSGWQQEATSDFYPASGYRHRASGALTYVGAYGYSWSSAPSASGSVNAGYLGFNATDVYPLISNARANGFPVRCVRE